MWPVAWLSWNKAFWSDFQSHVTYCNQKECLISAYLHNSKKYDNSSTLDNSLPFGQLFKVRRYNNFAPKIVRYFGNFLKGSKYFMFCENCLTNFWVTLSRFLLEPIGHYVLHTIPVSLPIGCFLVSKTLELWSIIVNCL